jgi:hypothetical protein
MCQTSGIIIRVILVKSAVSTYIPLPTRTWLRAFQYFKILYGILLLLLLPLSLQPAVDFGLSKNILPFFFYQSPTFTIFLLPALEYLFLLPLYILSWTVRYQLVEISLRLLPPLSNSIASHRMVVLVHRPGLRGHQISRPLTTPCGETWRTWSTGKNRSKRRATAEKHAVLWPRQDEIIREAANSLGEAHKCTSRTVGGYFLTVIMNITDNLFSLVISNQNTCPPPPHVF